MKNRNDRFQNDLWAALAEIVSTRDCGGSLADHAYGYFVRKVNKQYEAFLEAENTDSDAEMDLKKKEKKVKYIIDDDFPF